MPERLKHVWSIGRWRIAWRIGRYQTGFLRRGPGYFTFSLPFIWVRCIRRNKATADA